MVQTQRQDNNVSLHYFYWKTHDAAIWS